MAENEVVEAEAPKGLDAILTSAIDAHEAASEPAAEEKAAEPEQTELKLDAGQTFVLRDGKLVPKEQAPQTELKLDATGRAHGADGKFAPKKSEAEEPVKGQAEAKAPVQPTVKDTAAPPQQVQLPEAWPADVKAKIATLPPDHQQIAVEQYKAFQADYTRKTQEHAEQRKTVEPLLNTVAQVAPVLQQMGTTPDRFLAESATVAHRIMTGTPQQQGEAIAYLAQLHRVPPQAVLQAMGIQVSQDGTATPPPPEVMQLRQKIDQLERSQQQWTEHQAQQERLRAQAEFEALGKSADGNGQPKYPHFDRVKGTMVKLVANDIATTWDQAYDIAVRSDNELFQKTVEAEKQRVAAESEKQRQAAVDKAKNARPVKESNALPGGGPQAKGLDAHLSAALERFN